MEWGQREIYTAGLKEVDEEDFDIELLHEEGDTVVEDHFHHPKTKGDGAKYNNLGELADFKPE